MCFLNRKSKNEMSKNILFLREGAVKVVKSLEEGKKFVVKSACNEGGAL